MGTQIPRGLVFKQVKHIISSKTEYVPNGRRITTVYKAQPVALLRPETEGKKEVVIRCQECQQEVKIEVKSRKGLWRDRFFIGLVALVLLTITYGLLHLDNVLSKGWVLSGLGALACIGGMFVEDGVSMQASASHSLGDVPRKMKKTFRKAIASGAASRSSPQQNTDKMAR